MKNPEKSQILDTIDEYFNCVETCDDNDNDCTTECVTILKETESNDQ